MLTALLCAYCTLCCAYSVLRLIYAHSISAGRWSVLCAVLWSVLCAVLTLCLLHYSMLTPLLQDDGGPHEEECR